MPEPLKSHTPIFAALDTLAFSDEAPQLSAVLKQEFEDFRVDEEFGFAFTGEGEHLCLQVKKTDLSTAEVVRRISEVSGVRKSSIGYAGLKDRRGECSQWFSIQLPLAEESRLQGFENDSLQILQTQRNSRKIRIGSHKSNHFQIRLRNCVGAPGKFDACLKRMLSTGIPNYFAEQRFGRQMSNLFQAHQLLLRQLEQSAGAIQEAPGANKRFKRGMLYSAVRSYLFNQLLSQRLKDKTWNQYLSGDVLNLSGTDRYFVLPEGGRWDQEMQQRLDSFDIHISGVLPGLIDVKDKYVSSGESADIEDAVFKQYDILLKGLRHCGLKASRRAFRLLPDKLEWQWLTEEDDSNRAALEDSGITGTGKDLLLEFSLPKGAYATSLLRELCNTT